MRLLVSIGASVLCAAAIAAVLYGYVVEHAAAPAFWQSDPIATAWVAFAGAGGILVLCYLVFAFALVTSFAYLDLATAYGRIARAEAAGIEAPERHWQEAFANSDFAAMAAQLTPYELAAAPLSLLRLLRTEMWRVYGKRLLCAVIIAFALGGAVAALGLAPVPALSVPPAVGRWQGLAAAIAVVIFVAAWLAMDNAVGRLARTMTRASAEWTDAAPLSTERLDGRPGVAARLAGATPDDLIAAVERLVAALALRPPGTPESNAGTTAAVERLNVVLQETGREQCQAIERLGEQVAAQGVAMSQQAEAARSDQGDASALSAAMAALAVAVDKLADPVLRRMQLLGATDRRLLAVLERQEHVVGAINTRWNQLAAALHAMSAGLGSVAQAAVADRTGDTRVAPASDPAELNDELQELLDEISTQTPPSVRRTAT